MIRISSLSRTAFLALAAALPLAACGGKVPCPVCYEDAWSREPFPGQPKQHLRALTPDDLTRGAPVGTREFLGQTGGEEPY